MPPYTRGSVSLILLAPLTFSSELTSSALSGGDTFQCSGDAECAKAIIQLQQMQLDLLLGRE